MTRNAVSISGKSGGITSPEAVTRLPGGTGTGDLGPWVGDLAREEGPVADLGYLRAMMAAAPVALFVIDPEATVTEANSAAMRLVEGPWDDHLRLRCGDLLGCTHRLEAPRGCGTGTHCETCFVYSALREVLGGSGGIRDREVCLDLETEKGQEERFFTLSVEPLEIEGRRHAVAALMDITERRQATTALAQSEAKARAIYEHLPHPTFVWQRRDGKFFLSGFNAKAREVTMGGVTRWEGRRVEELYQNRPDIVADIERAYAQGAPFTREMDYQYLTTGRHRRLRVTYGPVPPDLVLVHTEDVTEQRRTEEQLVGSQRLEAIGKLAGGVAHDFNNLLSVIQSYQSFAIEELRAGDPVREDIMEAQRAARRAATLTRQLLAFGRRQVLEPKPLNLNILLGGLEALLCRLIGEDVEVRLHLAEGLGSVMADPGQIEQVLMNLAVNARDAMPRGGKLTIETCSVTLDEEYAARHVAVIPGDYVLLSVSDTGTGMAQDVQDRIFEPFFTTKPTGKGTGLGLSTAYGIVKQSGGNIWVYSEPGLGATFKVYLPLVKNLPVGREEPSEEALSLGDELVLVVEDEEAVRKIVTRILRAAGYQVISAGGGGEALLLCEERQGRVDLLLTDVVMPQMSGRQLADRLVPLCPGMKVLFMSGYTDDAVVHHGILSSGTAFISKPFSAAELTRKVREALGHR